MNGWFGVCMVALVLAVVLGVFWFERYRERARRTIYKLLAEHGELTGRQLVELSEGTLDRSMVYIDLTALEDEGLVQRRAVSLSPGMLPIYQFSLRERDP